MVDSTLISDRLIAVDTGLGLDKLVNDEMQQVRAKITEKGFGLDMFVSDSAEVTRVAVA